VLVPLLSFGPPTSENGPPKPFSCDKFSSLWRDCTKLELALLLVLLLIPLVLAVPSEVSGVVTNVVDGDTFDVQDFGRVRLADIDCPEIGTTEGAVAKAYTISWLQSNLVYLDVDDKTGQDIYGRWVCVAYLPNIDGSINISRNFNRMLVDSGNAVIRDFTNNEFTPASWWSGYIPVGGASWSPYTSASVSNSYLGNKITKVYHYPSCSWGQKILPANRIWFSSVEEAIRYGYRPCQKCYPPTTGSFLTSVNPYLAPVYSSHDSKFSSENRPPSGSWHDYKFRPADPPEQANQEEGLNWL